MDEFDRIVDVSYEPGEVEETVRRVYADSKIRAFVQNEKDRKFMGRRRPYDREEDDDGA